MYWTVVFGAALFALVALNRKSGYAASLVSCMLLLIWELGIIVHGSLGPDADLKVGMVCNTLATLYCLAAWHKVKSSGRPRHWLILLMLLFAAQNLGHWNYDHDVSLHLHPVRRDLQELLARILALQILVAFIGPRVIWAGLGDWLKYVGAYAVSAVVTQYRAAADTVFYNPGACRRYSANYKAKRRKAQ